MRVLAALHEEWVCSLLNPEKLAGASPCSPARPVWFVSCFNRPGGLNECQTERTVSRRISQLLTCLCKGACPWVTITKLAI
jgi:hypothetical protein